MSDQSFISIGFTNGVISPRLIFRDDMEFTDLGLLEGRNWFVNYTGGASIRPGSRFADYIQDDDEPARIVRFQFNKNLGNTYGVLFAKNRIRFIQDEAYVVEASQPIVTLGATVEVTAHGYADGDWIKIGGRTMEVDNATANTFTLLDPFGVVYDPTGSGATTVARIYTISSPYATADLQGLTFDQFKDELYITSNDYLRRKLTRFGTTNWVLDIIGNNANHDKPSSITVTSSSAGTVGAVYAVVPVNLDGVEGYLQTQQISEVLIDFTTTSGDITITWPAVTDTLHYEVYRTLFYKTGTQTTFSDLLGYIGKSVSTRFVDNNIVPDFTKVPLVFENPMANSRIVHINVTAGGSGYNKTGTTVSVSGGGGTNFLGTPVVDDTGAIVGVLILNHGTGYSASPTVTFSGAGTGATGTAVVSDASGNNPSHSTIIQQRRIFVGTENQPMTLFGSRIRDHDNFSTTTLGLATDPYNLTLDSSEMTPVRYIAKSRLGMFLFTSSDILQVRGVDDAVLTVDTIKSEDVENISCGQVAPLKIGRSYLFRDDNGDQVLEIAPSNLPTYYTVRSVSWLSNHYFSSDNKIIYHTWAQTPDRITASVREDGTMLWFCYVPEHAVLAWTDFTTEGFYEDVSTVNENSVDKIYTIVRRNIGGVEKRFIEVFGETEYETVEDMNGLDSYVESALTYPAASVDLDAYEGATVTATASSAIFTSGDVGKHFRAEGCYGVVAAFQSATAVTINITRAVRKIIPEFEVPPTFAQGEWSMTSPSTTFSGLHHLKGMEVDVLADGADVGPKTVTNGAVTLDIAASKVKVGLNFSAKLKTLPISASDGIVNDLQKRVPIVALRLYKARGFAVGDDVQQYPVKARTTELYGAAPDFINKLYPVHINTGYDYDGSIVVTKQGPVSGTLLGLLRRTELGDT